MPQIVSQTPQTRSPDQVPATLAWDQISAPGAYVCNWSGHLLRVPVESAPTNSASGFNIVGTDPLFVTKISDDPDLNLQRARQVAAQLNLDVDF